MLVVTWEGLGRKAQVAPNPHYPEGVALDATGGHPIQCATTLPYPAPECGTYFVECDMCGRRLGITAAGRPDDPRVITLPCGAAPIRTIEKSAFRLT